jgi:fucose permease
MKYRNTVRACYLCYVGQAAVNNLPPLLFVTFQRQFGVDISQVGLLIMLNFGIQLVANLLTGRLSALFGYRRSIVFSTLCSFSGLFLIWLLPPFIGFSGVVAGMAVGAAGSGIGDVLGSAIIQAIPREKEGGNALALLHSTYCWGMVLVIGVSTVLFGVWGTDSWRYVALFWSAFPLADSLAFLRVPLVSLEDGQKSGVRLKRILSQPLFWVFAGMMFCGAGAELSMSQWASLFAERGLGVDKALGDLLGPCLFALCMALVRTWYGVRKKMIPMRRYLFISAVCAVALYFVAVFSTNRFVALLGCAFIGFAVALFWPGTFSLSAASIPWGGTTLFGVLAFSGNIGSTLGPQVVSLAASSSGNLKHGLLLASLFPLGMAVLAALSGKIELKRSLSAGS